MRVTCEFCTVSAAQDYNYFYAPSCLPPAAFSFHLELGLEFSLAIMYLNRERAVGGQVLTIQDFLMSPSFCLKFYSFVSILFTHFFVRMY